VLARLTSTSPNMVHPGRAPETSVFYAPLLRLLSLKLRIPSSAAPCISESDATEIDANHAVHRRGSAVLTRGFEPRTTIVSGWHSVH
jgi:hypothetical protein